MMDVLIYKGIYNSGKTITLRLLFSKLINLDLVEDSFELNRKLLNKNDYYDISKIARFDAVTNNKMKASAEKKIDLDDFYSIVRLNNKIIFIISHSIASDEFKYALNKFKETKPDLIIASAKYVEQHPTVYDYLQEIFSPIHPKNYLELISRKVNSSKIENEKKLEAERLLNIILHTLNGQNISELDYFNDLIK